MSPTVLQTGNLRVVVRTKEQGHLGRPHVHVFGPGAEASFDLETAKCLANDGFTQKQIGRIEKFLANNLELLKETWNDYHK